MLNFVSDDPCRYQGQDLGGKDSRLIQHLRNRNHFFIGKCFGGGIKLSLAHIVVLSLKMSKSKRRPYIWSLHFPGAGEVFDGPGMVFNGPGQGGVQWSWSGVVFNGPGQPEAGLNSFKTGLGFNFPQNILFVSLCQLVIVGIFNIEHN